MSTHWGAVEADFQSHYGLDLREACYGSSPVGTRRLKSLLLGLPKDSALHREMEPSGWTWNEELLASLLEMVDTQIRLFVQAHSRKGAKLPKALKIPRPYQQELEKPKPTHADVKRFFGAA